MIPAEKGSAFDGISVQRKTDSKSVQSIVSMMEVYLGGSHKEIIDGQFYSATAKIIFAVSQAMLCAALCIAAGVYAKKPGDRQFCPGAWWQQAGSCCW